VIIAALWPYLTHWTVLFLYFYSPSSAKAANDGSSDLLLHFHLKQELSVDVEDIVVVKAM
jgi:hypothetical protein